jgi:hypothetical protein
MQPDRPLPVLDTVHKRTATHTTMNEFVVEFYGFGWKFGPCRFHEFTLDGYYRFI